MLLSSEKEIELPTKTPTITKDEFIKLLYTFMFQDKDPLCSFKIVNLQEKGILNCSTDIPVVKRCFAQIFKKPKKVDLVEQTNKKVKVKRWRSRSPKWERKKRRTKRKKRRRSRSSERV